MERMSLQNMLRPELVVLRIVGGHSEGVHLAALEKELASSMSRGAIIRALSRLMDLGMVRAEWTKEQGWKRKYFVSGEGTEVFLGKLEEMLRP